MMSTSHKRGFTLVELMVSMTFIAILLLAIAMLILQITAIYNKGLTMREANQAGRFITSELQRSLNQTYTDEVIWARDNGFPEGGDRLCAGSMIYVWNYDLNSGQNKVGGSSDVRFMKFTGNRDQYCKIGSDGDWTEPIFPPDARELLSEGNSDIALHGFTFTPVTTVDDTTQTLYNMTMVVGTTDMGLISSSNCNAKDEIGDQRCAINEFSFTARSGNKEDSQP